MAKEPEKEPEGQQEEVVEEHAAQEEEQPERTDDEQGAEEQAEATPEPEQEAPSVVERLLPNAAREWSGYTVEQQQAIVGDLVQGLQASAEIDGGGQEGGQEGSEPAATDEPAGREARPRTVPNVQLADGISDEEVTATKEYFDGEPLVLSLLHKVISGHGASRDIGKATVEWIETFGQSQELVDAKAAHKRELTALGPQGAKEILKAAGSLKKQRGIPTMTDAVSVALYEKGKPATKTNRTAASVASSLSTSGKGRGRVRPQKPEKFGSPSAAYQWHLDHPEAAG